jgi:hypothetical protein
VVSTSESTVVPVPVPVCTLTVRPMPSSVVVVKWLVPLLPGALFAVVAVTVQAPEV